MTPQVESFFHRRSGTLSYLVYEGRDALIIDAVLDFDVVSGRVDPEPADAIARRASALGLNVHWVIDTHAHADHLSGSHHLKQSLGARLGMGRGIRQVHATFAPVFNDDAAKPADFDELFEDEQTFSAGALRVRVLRTPGHTDDSVTYLVGDAAFVGDTLFAPARGTARCDFPGGSAEALYDTVQTLYALPPQTRLFLCHDYPAADEEPVVFTTVQAQRDNNVRLSEATDRATFVAWRQERDATLSLPALIIPALQVNVRGGELPAADDNGVRYLRLPINQF